MLQRILDWKKLMDSPGYVRKDFKELDTLSKMLLSETFL